MGNVHLIDKSPFEFFEKLDPGITLYDPFCNEFMIVYNGKSQACTKLEISI